MPKQKNPSFLPRQILEKPAKKQKDAFQEKNEKKTLFRKQLSHNRVF
jgi:hypothetical protein